ncbi:MAG: hypothetical protein M1587_04060, partial [Thaumarchaeota archaeon]|nr:hypothetical protein [Nitrososphaerota archaeon]
METNSVDNKVTDDIEAIKSLPEELEQVATTIELPKETLDFFNNDELRARVFYEKYALKNLDGVVVER